MNKDNCNSPDKDQCDGDCEEGCPANEPKSEPLPEPAPVTKEANPNCGGCCHRGKCNP